MPSIAIQSAKVAVTAASATGLLTLDSNAYIFPGAFAWVSKDDGSAQARVKVLFVSGTNQVQVRRCPTIQDPTSGVKYDSDRAFQGNYGYSDMSAFATGCHLYQEAQTVPVDPAYAKRVLP